MRADKFFAEKFGSRSKAADALKAGLVLYEGRALDPDSEIEAGAEIESFTYPEPKSLFVSNGGGKLARALDVFGVDVSGKVYADFGASTGGFTDVLLRRGCGRVFCVDVGKSLLAPVLAADERVTVMDRTNARYLKPSDFPVPLDGVVGDLSFISLRMILPAVCSILSEGGRAFLLFKPQFECGREALGKSGICPRRLHAGLLASFYTFSLETGLAPRGVVNAPLKEKKNIEYMVFFEKGGTPLSESAFLAAADRLFEENSKNFY